MNFSHLTGSGKLKLQLTTPRATQTTLSSPWGTGVILERGGIWLCYVNRRDIDACRSKQTEDMHTELL